MSPRAWIALAALAGAIGAAAWGASSSRAPAVGASSAPASVAPAASSAPAKARALEWSAGTRHVYTFAWKSEHAVRVANGEAMAVAVDLAGELAIDAFGKRGDAFVLATSFASLSRAHLAINGKPVYADDAATAKELAGKRAVVELGPRGTIKGISIDADPEGTFRHLMRGVLVELSVTLPSGAEDTLSETGPNGIARTHYALDPHDPSRVRRRREQYETLAALGARQVVSDEAAPTQQLDARATIVLGADGAFASIASDEHLVVASDGRPSVVARSTFEMKLASVSQVDAPAPALVDPRPLDAPVASTELSRKLLEQRVDGLTVARMKVDLLIFATTGSIVDQERWVWRATGLLEQKPEACADLVAAFESAGLDGDARALVLDLLASVGHARAQAAMREALASRAATSDKARMQLFVQRFAFVASPDRESVAFLLKARADALSQGEPRLADAIDYTLGSVAAHLAATGQAERAVALHERLVAQLGAAKSGRERKVALAALGNAGFEADAPRIMQLAADDDEDVRSQVAWSLRKLESPETRRALVDLVGDARTAVQTSAAKALASMTLEDADLAALEAIVRADRVKATTYVALVALLPAGDAHARAIVEHLVAKGDADADALAKMRAWLDAR